MRLADFDYELPAELIAQHPPKERGASRLLHLDGASGKLVDRAFSDLPQLVDARDVLVLNETRVIKARLFGAKSSGGRVELFVERMLGEHEALALMRAGHSPKPGARLSVGDGVAVEVLGARRIFTGCGSRSPVAAGARALRQRAAAPLYLTPAGRRRRRALSDRLCAQPGAVAAPTAGLHFDEVSFNNK